MQAAYFERKQYPVTMQASARVACEPYSAGKLGNNSYIQVFDANKLADRSFDQYHTCNCLLIVESKG
jgi:hypothetical protein